MLSIIKLKAPYKDFLFALISAALLVLSFPKPNFYWLAWVGLVPLLIGLQGKSLGRAFALAFTMGIAFLMGIYYWINVIENFALTDFFLLGIFLGAYFGFFGLFYVFISTRTPIPFFVIAPCVWVAIEYARSLGGFVALPWPFLGYSQFQNLRLIRIANFSGVYGVSFLLVMANGALTELIVPYLDRSEARVASRRRWSWFPGIITAGIFGLCFWYGVNSTGEDSPNPTTRVAVIQGNIPQNLRWNVQLREKNLERHVELTRRAAEGGKVSLVVWPETTVQGSLEQNKYLSDKFTHLAGELHSYFLLGSADRPKFGFDPGRGSHLYNSAFLVSPNGYIAGRYDKIHLLPFGEYLPWKSFPWPARIASAWAAGEFSPGTTYTLFSLDNHRFGVSICWESIFPDHFRRFVKQGATFMVNITNEAWFGKTAAPYQFMAMTVFRAVENRVAIARAANTGISGFIDPFGRILGVVTKADQDIFVEGFLAMDIPISEDRTFYTEYGDLFAYACIGFLILMIGIAFAHRLHNNRG